MKQANDYSNIENRRAEQANIVRWKQRLYIVISLVLSFSITMFFFSGQREISSIGDVFVNWTAIGGNSPISKEKYLIVGGGILIILFILIYFPSKRGLIRRIEVLGKKGKKVSLFLKAEFKLISLLDQITYYLFFPISYFLFNIDEHIKEMREKFYFRVGWFEHIELSFFKEVIIKVDGYERADELKTLSKYKELFSSEKGDKVYTCPIYQTIYKIFLNEKEMRDLMLITEGYLSLNKNEKYDRILDQAEYKKRLKEKFQGKVENFRCYDGLEEVLFSHNLIKELVDSEVENFTTYMSRYIAKSGQSFTRVFKKNFRLIKEDSKLLKKIADFNLPNATKVDLLKDNDEVLTSRIIMLCSAYFRIVAFKHIIGQYMNLPAGTMVVKIEDYTARMILEVFDEGVLIQVITGKNDGKSKNFESDALVNIFLAAYNFYNLSSKYSFVQKVDDIFNFRDSALGELRKEEEKDNNKMLEGFEEGYREPTSEELEYLSANVKER